jgi:rhodanese-related sulfurtransferase
MTQNTVVPDLPPLVQPGELAERLRQHPEIRLLDVRTPAEFVAVHVPGAYNVPLDTLPEHAREVRTGGPLVLICQSGRRARSAEDVLARTGLSSVHVLDGGMTAWLDAGLPVRRGRPSLSLERQVRIAAGALAALGGLLAALVDPAFGLVAAFVGGGLVFAGLTDTCGMALLLARLPYNRRATCDIGAAVRALSAGEAAVPGADSSTVRQTCCQ